MKISISIIVPPPVGPAAAFEKRQLALLVAESAHGVTSIASFILLTDIGDQHLRALHLDFEGSDQRIFGVNDNVFRFPLKFKADRKLHRCSPAFSNGSTIQLRGVNIQTNIGMARSTTSDQELIPRPTPLTAQIKFVVFNN
jgi:hypothetical protein